MRTMMSAGPGEVGDFDPRDEFDERDGRGYTAEELQQRHVSRMSEQRRARLVRWCDELLGRERVAEAARSRYPDHPRPLTRMNIDDLLALLGAAVRQRLAGSAR